MAYAILRVAKIRGNLSTIQGHNNREREDRSARVDPSKSNRNIQLIQSTNFAADLDKRLQGLKIRKNAVAAMEVMITASPEYFREDPDAFGIYDQEKVDLYNKTALEYLKNEYGQDNIISAVCHLDEKSPHIHAIIAAVSPDNKVGAGHWLDGRVKLQQLQDRYYAAVKHLGLERGIEGSEATHSELKELGGAINQEVPQVPTIAIPVPPLIGNREKWATEESRKANNSQAKAIELLEKQAKMAVIATKKAREHQRTAEKYAAENARLKAENEALREIPIKDVLALYEHRKVGKSYEINGESIAVDGQRFFNHYLDKGGRGSIDLVMQLENCDFRGAVAFLSQHLGEAKAIGSALVKTQTEAREHAKQPAPLPTPVHDNWPGVRDYLINQRKLNPIMVDKGHEMGIIYADYAKNAVFIHGRKAGAEKTGTRGIKWKGFNGSKENGFKIPTKKPDGVIFVESAIDALSFHELKNKEPFLKYKKFDIISVAGVGTDTVVKLSSQYKDKKILIGFDNDEAGNKAHERISRIIDVERLTTPDNSKDWNEVLAPKQQAIEPAAVSVETKYNNTRGMEL